MNFYTNVEIVTIGGLHSEIKACVFGLNAVRFLLSYELMVAVAYADTGRICRSNVLLKSRTVL